MNKTIKSLFKANKKIYIVGLSFFILGTIFGYAIMNISPTSLSGNIMRARDLNSMRIKTDNITSNTKSRIELEKEKLLNSEATMLLDMNYYKNASYVCKSFPMLVKLDFDCQSKDEILKFINTSCEMMGGVISSSIKFSNSCDINQERVMDLLQ